MKTSIYSIYDNVAEVFNKPFQDINDATAMRNFKASVANGVHKNDYVLYKIGDFTDHDGMLVPVELPKKLLTGMDVKVEENLEN